MLRSSLERAIACSCTVIYSTENESRGLDCRLRGRCKGSAWRAHTAPQPTDGTIIAGELYTCNETTTLCKIIAVKMRVTSGGLHLNDASLNFKRDPFLSCSYTMAEAVCSLPMRSTSTRRSVQRLL